MPSLLFFLSVTTIIPSSGTEKTLAEIDQGLDLRGQWTGVWCLGKDNILVASLWSGIARENKGDVYQLRGIGNKFELLCRFESLVDEGSGKCHFHSSYNGKHYLGIYRREGEKIILCFQEVRYGRPRIFRVSEFSELLVLRRVTPCN